MDKFVTREKRVVATMRRQHQPLISPKHVNMMVAIFNLKLTVAGTNSEPLPQCVICADLLANDSMKPCKLKHHLETKHPT